MAYIIRIIDETKETVKDPKVFSKIIGQEDAKKSIEFFVQSHSLEYPVPTLLFTGSHGLGKSMFSSLIAKALGREFIEVNCGSIKTVEEFVESVIIDKLMGETEKTLLLDESHKLSQQITTFLLTVLNPNKNLSNEIPYGKNYMNWDLRKINVIFATTDSFKIFKPLKNRCHEVYFNQYSNEELFEIVKNYLPSVEITCDKEKLAQVCRGRARDAYVLSLNIKRYLIHKSKVFDDDGLDKIMNIFGIKELGLKKNEYELLKIVFEQGPISASNMAIQMMVQEENIEDEIEIRLKELGLICNTNRGRLVTEKGKEYLARVK
jgi:Holliday junction DNA helicase RuvB